MMELVRLHRVIVMMIMFIAGTILAASGSWGELAIINETGDPVLITFKRSPQGITFKKLLEVQEGLNFGRVTEALLQGTGLLDTAPAEVQIFPPKTLQATKEKEDCVITIKGVKNRGIMSPFGEWDVKIVSTEFIHKVPPTIKMPSLDNIYGAFPTVGRKLVPTPRYILGLPSDATVADAVEAENILSHRWLELKGESPETDKIILEVIKVLNTARKAFEHGKPDEPLSFALEIGIS